MLFYCLIFRMIFVHVNFFIIIIIILFFCLHFLQVLHRFILLILYSWMNHMYFHFQGIHSSFMKKLYVFSSSQDCSMFDLKLELTALISSPKN
jgi:hypothetical protein